MKKDPTKTMTMVEYVLKQEQEYIQEPSSIFIKQIAKETFRFAAFLSRPIKLGDFIPTDFEGNVLEKPKRYHIWINYGASAYDSPEIDIECKQYQEALDRLVYSGVELIDEYSGNYIVNHKSVLVNGEIIIKIDIDEIYL